MKSWTLEGKTALITGASKGIGLATADEFLALGAEILIVARGEDTLNEVLAERKGQKIHSLPADVASETGRNIIFTKINDLWGKLDILVNNVGRNIRKATLEYDSAEVHKIFEINLFSAFELCRSLYPFLQKGINPAIVNVASVAGVFDVKSGSPYGMTKAAEIQLTRHLAAEWAKDNIRVNAVSPWYTVTPLTEAVLSIPERLQGIIDRTPLGRVAQVEEMAAVIAFLAMDKASYITGQNLMVDGGMSIKGL
ncbi:MAG: SDR family oxidoreductase [Saprospiraceae bacterium]|nr:SDR family oxidoreductase [Saprospiraceae bacterium]